MKRIFAGLAALLLGAQSAPPTVAPAGSLDAARVTAVLDAAGFSGTALIAQGDRIVYERAFGTIDPAGGAKHRLGQVWRWASVTKQLTATIAMQEVAAGRLDLDTPIRAYLPDSRAPYADIITPRMLMQHISGVPRTEDSPTDRDGWQRFYTAPAGSPDTGRAWCEGPTPRKPPAEFHYGDCDFILMGAVLERTSGLPFATLFDRRLVAPLRLKSAGLFPRSRPTVPGYEKSKLEPASMRLENFGAAGAAYGTTRDLLAFDRALMTGRLVPNAQRAILWTGDPKLGYSALGQWVFSSPLKGCTGPIRFVERRGAINVVLRNIIMPERDTVVILTSNRDEADAALGEIWQQKGITHDVLAAALCPPA